MISNEELTNVKGGSKSLIAGIIGSVITFFIGVVDGYFRPIYCNGK